MVGKPEGATAETFCPQITQITQIRDKENKSKKCPQPFRIHVNLSCIALATRDLCNLWMFAPPRFVLRQGSEFGTAFAWVEPL